MSLFPEPQNMTNIVEFLRYINEGTNVNGMGGMLGVVMVLILGGVAFMIAKAFTSFENAGVYAMAFSMIIGIFVYGLGLISFTVLAIILIFFVITIYFLMNENE